ncbi:hypothetical protein NBRC110019_18880 [Neptunitalea chrysea]|uniref:GOLD domain-containing protein n=2 Tax=Neptunitalea chrysea TaxID=1647581 RepID=A0A9W6B568_9FLAO|nr:hypothetical protein NBRC110019_18880 [Neptunitalea chrysea]
MRTMKKYALLLIVALVSFSCSIDDDENVNYRFEFVATDTVEFPSEIYVNNTYNVTIYYTLPNSCYYINGIDYNYTDDYERTVALVATVYDGTNCDANTVLESTTFDFKPINAGTYTFNFLTGQDDNGDYTYSTYDVVVLE